MKLWTIFNVLPLKFLKENAQCFADSKAPVHERHCTRLQKYTEIEVGVYSLLGQGSKHICSIYVDHRIEMTE